MGWGDLTAFWAGFVEWGKMEGIQTKAAEVPPHEVVCYVDASWDAEGDGWLAACAIPRAVPRAMLCQPFRLKTFFATCHLRLSRQLAPSPARPIASSRHRTIVHSYYRTVTLSPHPTSPQGEELDTMEWLSDLRCTSALSSHHTTYYLLLTHLSHLSPSLLLSFSLSLFYPSKSPLQSRGDFWNAGF